MLAGTVAAATYEEITTNDEMKLLRGLARCLNLLGDGLAGDGGPLQRDQLVVAGRLLPPAHEIADKRLASATGQYRGQVRTSRSVLMAAVNSPALDRK